MKPPVLRSALHSAMDRPLSQPWWRLKVWQRLLLGVATVILLIVAGVLLLGPAQRSVSIPATSLTIATTERGVYHDVIPLTGEVVPHDTVDLDALEGGRIERVLVQAGDTVTIPEGTWHNARNICSEDAVLSISYSSPDRISIGEE